MAHYRKIDVQIWNDPLMVSASDDTKLAWVFLISHQNLVSAGAMRGTLKGLASELNWTEKRLKKALSPFIEHGSLVVDDKVAFIGLTRWLKHNKPENPNAVTSLAASIDKLPACKALDDLVRQCFEWLAENKPSWTNGYVNRLPNRYRNSYVNRLPNQEQEHEQEQDIKKKYVPTNVGTSSPRAKKEPEQVDLDLADRLAAAIRKNKPDFHFTDGQRRSWADDFRKARTVKNRTPERLLAVIAWCQRDQFWHRNILSANKLYEKLDKLELDMTDGKRMTVDGRPHGTPAPTRPQACPTCQGTKLKPGTTERCPDCPPKGQQ